MTSVDTPQAEWIKDGEQWAVLVPPHLAKAGERVTVARADGSREREVVIREVTARRWRGMVVCRIE